LTIIFVVSHALPVVDKAIVLFQKEEDGPEERYGKVRKMENAGKDPEIWTAGV